MQLQVCRYADATAGMQMQSVHPFHVIYLQEHFSIFNLGKRSKKGTVAESTACKHKHSRNIKFPVCERENNNENIDFITGQRESPDTLTLLAYLY